jgi:hypothetical protein
MSVTAVTRHHSLMREWQEHQERTLKALECEVRGMRQPPKPEPCRKMRLYADVVMTILDDYHPLPLTPAEIAQEAKEKGYNPGKVHSTLRALRQSRAVSWRWHDGKLNVLRGLEP